MVWSFSPVFTFNSPNLFKDAGDLYSTERAIFEKPNILCLESPQFPKSIIPYRLSPTHPHPSNIPQSRLQSKSEDLAEEEHWLLSVQDSWKTSSTSLLVLSLLFILLLLLLGLAAVKIAKHLFRQFCHILRTFLKTL